VGPFRPASRPVTYTPNPAYWGPDHIGPCPCGSGKQAGSCHVNKAKGDWKLPPYKPALIGAKTGISCAGCFASFTNDCEGKLSDEHWLSKGIALRVGTNGRVQIIWKKKPQQVVQASAFSEKVLCERHNNALNRLDATAIAVFDTLDHFQTDQGSQPDPHGSEFDLYSGEALERWLLKLLWGGTASGAFTENGTPITALREPGKYQVMLADYLFRGGKLPPGWGMYILAHGAGVNLRADGPVAVVTGSINGELVQGCVAMRVVEFTFAFGTLRSTTGGDAVLRPRAVELKSLLDPAHKVLALGWDHGNTTSEPVTYTYQRAK
jgi:hypothetical protein